MATLNTFGNSKEALRIVVDNGVDITDTVRIMSRANEATQLILSFRDKVTGAPIIPVNGMMIVELTADADGFFLLPPEMDSVTYFEVIDGNLVNGQNDTVQGFYNIVNPATYLEPGMTFDNPLEDHFFTGVQAGGILQRRYRYPGFKGGKLRVVGPKGYMPIVNDNSVLIVQNIAALKAMILAIEYHENNQGGLYKQYFDDCLEIITGEVKRHNMDPRWVQKRKGEYEADLVRYQQGSKGWMRARMALEVPGALMVGREDLGRILDRGQLRMMEDGTYKGCLEEFNMTVTNGHGYLPARVESMLGASMDGQPFDIRSMFFKYLKNGPGDSSCSCGDARLDDEGERYFPESGDRRRVYRIRGATDGSALNVVCKLRWLPKEPEEQMVILNLEANRVMVQSILMEQAEQWNEAMQARQLVLGKDGILQKELGEYLAGIKHTIPFTDDTTFSMNDLGSVF